MRLKHNQEHVCTLKDFKRKFAIQGRKKITIYCNKFYKEDIFTLTYSEGESNFSYLFSLGLDELDFNHYFI